MSRLGPYSKLPYAADYVDYFVVNELQHMAANGHDRVELTVMAHGAGTQTSVLLALASTRWRAESDAFPEYNARPGQEGWIDLDLAMFADVGDGGTECEWPETIEFLEGMSALSTVPIVMVSPGVWNNTLAGDHRGLYDRYLDRSIIPVRMFRSCTDHFKIRPQEKILRYFHAEAARVGIDLRVRQVIGYSYDERHRAEKFVPAGDFVEPWFPLIEWEWNRERTLAEYAYRLPDYAEILGVPQKSGCWFCPFQKRGKRDPVTLETKPRTWLALYEEYPHLYQAALEMERASNERRADEGKKPIYLYGGKPLTYWMDPLKNVTQTGFKFLADFDEGELGTDDTCSSWGCFR